MEDEGGRSGRSLDALLGEIARAPEVTPAESLVGTTLGRFRIEALLGRGGMGVVYRAEDTKLARDVALKVLRPELVGDRERRSRFLREARLAASMTHAGTAAIFDVGEEGDVVWVAMELVRGETLRVLLDRGRLPVDRVVAIARDVARGLARAHERGIVHRDLKPENVMIDEGGHAKILDFGLAKALEAEAEGTPSTASTELGRVLGTPSYMSPEQAKGRPVDARSDVFSFGIVLYEMLAARRPFVGETTIEVLIAIDRDPPAPLDRDVPASLRAVVERCLAKDADERFADGAPIVEALESYRPPKRAGLPFARVALVGALFVAAATTAALKAKPRGATKEPTHAATAATVLAPADAVLACPLLEVTGVEAPSGWLGAAAANIACRRARWMLGGQDKSVQRPADLLGLPGAILDDGPADPFVEDGARERSIAAAKARATAYLDGSIERTDAAFHVVLVLRTRDGAEIARGDATSSRLDRAVAVAMAAPALAFPAKPLDPEIARWLGLSDPSLAVALEDWRTTILLLTVDDAPLRARASELGAWGPYVRALTASATGDDDAPTPPEIDRSSDDRFLRSVLARVVCHGAIDDSVADEVKAIGARLAPGALGRSLATSVEARVRVSRDAARAYDVFAASTAENPHWTMVWSESAALATPTRTVRTVSRTKTYWTPESPQAWLESSLPPKSFTTVPAMALRGWQLTPESVGAATAYASALLRAGKRDEPRLVAARLATGGPEQARDAEAILTAVDASFARFGGADARARAILSSLPRFGRGDDSITLLFVTFVDVAVLTGRGRELGDMFAERFVLADPPRLDRGPMTPGDVPGVCAVASPPVAKRCVARLEQLIADGYFRSGIHPSAKAHVDALKAHLEGDDRRAAELLHASFDYGRFERYPYVAEILDAAGDLEMADKVDGISFPFAGYNGAWPAHVRAAKRAARRHDIARARELATKVVDAWAAADVSVQAVREMHDLLAKLSP